jgi:hypothetical protein
LDSLQRKLLCQALGLRIIKQYEPSDAEIFSCLENRMFQEDESSCLLSRSPEYR